jgi:dTDP-4-dehydrorhamnose reductase
MKSYSRALIVGGQGQLSRALRHFAPAETEVISLSRSQLDITDFEAVAAAIAQAKPEIVFNGAAYNLVDKAETEGMADALRLNALGPAVLARACRESGVPLVHFSTDYVFDGAKNSPYSEADLTRPLGVYGASKLAGENIVLAGQESNFAIRVCRLFGPIEASDSMQKPAGNFPLLMMKLGRERESVRVVGDQIGTPTYTPDLARGVWQLVENSDGGLFQLSNGGEVSFADYARAVFEIADLSCRVEAISSEEYGAAARRPLYSTLDNGKAQAHGVEALRDWRVALGEFLISVS